MFKNSGLWTICHLKPPFSVFFFFEFEPTVHVKAEVSQQNSTVLIEPIGPAAPMNSHGPSVMFVEVSYHVNLKKKLRMRTRPSSVNYFIITLKNEKITNTSRPHLGPMVGPVNGIFQGLNDSKTQTQPSLSVSLSVCLSRSRKQ